MPSSGPEYPQPLGHPAAAHASVGKQEVRPPVRFGRNGAEDPRPDEIRKTSGRLPRLSTVLRDGALEQLEIPLDGDLPDPLPESFPPVRVGLLPDHLRQKGEGRLRASSLDN